MQDWGKARLATAPFRRPHGIFRSILLRSRVVPLSTTSFEVLQLQNNLTTARSAEIRALADYNIALEQLALDKGTTLERSKIDLKMP